MTEEQWLACASVGRALQTLNRLTRVVSPGWRRKFRLFGCHCLRRLQPLVPGDRFVRALDVAEQHFDGLATIGELKAAVAEAQEGYEVHRSDLEEPEGQTVQELDQLLKADPHAAAYGAAGAVLLVPGSRSDAELQAEMMQQVRDIFGNPFRPVAFDLSWRTSTAVALARQMYESREFSAMPILADALQDAGCENADILGHCRGPGPHVRGCWVVDLVLGTA
jgi:hypothetical protein